LLLPLLLLLGGKAAAQEFFGVTYDTLVPQLSVYNFLDINDCSERLFAYPNNRDMFSLTTHMNDTTYMFTIHYDPGSESQGLEFLHIVTDVTDSNNGYLVDFDLDTTIHAIGTGRDSMIYAAGRGLYRYNVRTEEEAYVGDFQPAVRSMRAMTLREDHLYMANTQNQLLRLNTSDPAQSELLHSFPDSIAQIESMATVPYSCDSIVTYAFAGRRLPGGDSTQVYILDFEDYSLTPVCTYPGYYVGVTYRDEAKLPPCQLYADLDSDNSTQPGFDYSTPFGCGGSFAIADADIEVFGQIGIDSITLRLLSTPDGGQEYLQGGGFGGVGLSGSGSAQLVLANISGTATFEDFEQALGSITYQNDAPALTFGQRQVEIVVHASYYEGEPSYAYINLEDNFLEAGGAVTPACFGENNGTATLSPQNGLAPVSVSWPDGGSGYARSGLSPGAYPVTLVDASGCTGIDTVFVPEQDSIQLSITAENDFICGENGVLTASVQGGTAPYSFIWNGQAGNTTLSGVGAGLYELTVMDSLGCEAVASYIISGGLDTTVTDTLFACPGESLEYEGQNYTSDTLFCDTYTAVSGCDSTYCTALVFQDTFLNTTTATPCAGTPYFWQNQSFTADTSLCLVYSSQYGCDSTYCLELSFISRVSEQQVQLCPGEAYTFGGEQLTAPGTYRDTIQDGQACDSIVTLQLSYYDPPGLQLSSSGSLCAGGTATLEAAGQGTFEWNDGSSGNTLSITAPGTYRVTLTDTNGCTAVDSLTLTEDTPDFIGSTGFEGCPSETGGYVQADSVWGGMPPYLFALEGGVLQAGNRFSGLGGGTYLLSVEDAAGCRVSRSFTLDIPPPLVAALPADTSIRLGQSVLLPLQSNAAAAAISWQPPQGLSCVDCLAPTASPVVTTAYEATLTDSLGCTATASVIVTVEVTTGWYAPTAFSPNDDGRNDRFQLYTDASIQEVRQLEVYGRWGGQVFTSTHSGSLSWDGSVRGELAPAGVYIFQAVLLRTDGRDEVVKGELVLLR
jgi:gliding motility-associated-like protein